MKRSDFHYELPPELIAQAPLAERSASRLLRFDKQSGELSDHLFKALPGLLNAGDLLVFNNTRVIPARLFGHKATGGRVEILVERILGEHDCMAQVRASKSPQPGGVLLLENGTELKVVGRDNSFFHLQTMGVDLMQQLELLGHIPLPPYISRQDTAADRRRYQTVYAEVPGAVAAPTAGLHFDGNLLQQLERAGIVSANVTLHVGAGTYQPVRAENIEDHHMHAEWLRVPQSTCDLIAATKKRGDRVIAVGTISGDSQIFIYPGYQFKVVDVMITNFHLPESTLLMLLSAFAGHQNTMAAYQHAVQQRYRFFSYGDAMLVA